MLQNNIASNIRRLRIARGYKQEELAKEVGISSAAFRNYEAGRAVPKTDTLTIIAAKLGARLPELIEEPKSLSHVRFRADGRLNTRESILVDVARWLDDYVELEDITSDTREWSLRDLPLLPPKQMAAEARKALKVGKREPITDICGLLEGAGIKLLSKPVKSEYFFGLCVGYEEGGPAIVVNTWDRIPVERWIFSAAHELGHILLHRDSFDVNEQKEEKQQESEANQFAAYFLMPEKLFLEEWEKTEGQLFVHRVLKVKRIFKVSYMTVLLRLNDLQLYDNVWPAFHSQYKRYFREHLTRKHEPNPLGPDAYSEDKASREPKRLEDVDFTEDRLSRLVYNALKNDLISRSRAAEILSISAEEMTRRIEDWAA